METATQDKKIGTVMSYGVRINIYNGQTPDTVDVFRWKGGVSKGRTTEPRIKWAKHITR